MNSYIRLLRLTYCSQLLTAILIAGLFESGAVHLSLDLSPSESYPFEMAGVALVLVLLPLALKLLHLPRVGALIHGDPQRYTQWSLVRLALLYVPLAFNLLAYYLLDYDTTCGYLALMTAVAFLFVWPSEEKMHYEYHQDEK